MQCVASGQTRGQETSPVVYPVAFQDADFDASTFGPSVDGLAWRTRSTKDEYVLCVVDKQSSWASGTGMDDGLVERRWKMVQPSVEGKAKDG